MTPEKLARLAALQDLERALGPLMMGTEVAELNALRRELAMAPEVADDKSTLFTDEASRPLLDGGNYNDTLKAMCWNEVEAALRKGLEVLGEVAVKAIVARTLP